MPAIPGQFRFTKWVQEINHITATNGNPGSDATKGILIPTEGWGGRVMACAFSKKSKQGVGIYFWYNIPDFSETGWKLTFQFDHAESDNELVMIRRYPGTRIYTRLFGADASGINVYWGFAE